MPEIAPGVRHAWHLFPILLDIERLTVDRATVFHALRAENIGVTVHYLPAYWHPYYVRLGYARGLCPRAEDVAGRVLSLPMHAGMTGADVEDVIRAVRKVLGHYLA